MSSRALTVSALPTVVNLNLYVGDDFYLTVTVTEPDGSPTDLSSATVTAQVRATAEDSSVLATFESSISGNVITLHLSAAESALLTPSCVWDCQLATPDITTLAAGTITATADVTRP